MDSKPSEVENINRMLTMKEVSQLLNVYVSTLRRWADQGVIKSYRVGLRGDRKFKAKDIVAFLPQASREVLVEMAEYMDN